MEIKERPSVGFEQMGWQEEGIPLKDKWLGSSSGGK